MLLKATIPFLIYGLLAIAASFHALTTKRDPRAAIGWIAVCVLFPLAGPLLYYFFRDQQGSYKGESFASGSWNAPWTRAGRV